LIKSMFAWVAPNVRFFESGMGEDMKSREGWLGGATVSPRGWAGRFSRNGDDKTSHFGKTGGGRGN